MNAPQKLIPLGTRILHWNGSGHGKGTIIGYNNIPENSYLRQNFGEAVNIAAHGGAPLLSGLVNSMYDGSRYPYVVQFDPRVEEENEHPQHLKIRLKYPRGYKDVYTGSPDDSELTLIHEPNVFPNDTVLYISRHWDSENQKWGDWKEMSETDYLNISRCKNTPDIQYISRAIATN